MQESFKIGLEPFSKNVHHSISFLYLIFYHGINAFRCSQYSFSCQGIYFLFFLNSLFDNCQVFLACSEIEEVGFLQS